MPGNYFLKKWFFDLLTPDGDYVFLYFAFANLLGRRIGTFDITVTKDVPGADNVKLSGTFLTKVFDGPYNAVPKWLKEMDHYVESKGKKTKKYYFYFTTCPKCAKKYRHNYVVAFAEVR